MSAHNNRSQKKKTKDRREERREEKREQTSRNIKKVAGGDFFDMRTDRPVKGNTGAARRETSSYAPNPDLILKIEQPEPVCVICGEKITQIETALVTRKRFARSIRVDDASEKDESELSAGDYAASALDGSGDSDEADSDDSAMVTLSNCFCHFDCALRYIKVSRQVHSPDRVSYVGGGGFAIFKYGKSKREFTISERIQFESKEDHLAMQEYIEGLKK